MKCLKKILCAALALLCITAFAGCKEQDGSGGDDGTQKGTKQNSESGIVYGFEYNGVKLTLGASADKIISALGEYRDKKEIGDCGGLGAQVKYSYASFDVYVLESKSDGNVIDQITFRDDLVETSEGACIGMSIDEIKLKTGTPTGSSDTSLEYLSGSKLLKFTVADGKITGIDYMTVSE